MPPIRHIAAVLEAQHGHLFPWIPVFLGAGIGTYFALPVEPGTDHLLLLSAGLVATCMAAWRLVGLRPLFMALALVLVGLGLGAFRSHSIAGPVATFRYYGPVEGRIIEIDRSMSEKVRLTLDQVVLARTPPARTPTRVRVSLHGEQGFVDPVPGMRVMMTANLSPPAGPVEPGGFDFRRHAWFEQLGAVGYTRAPVLRVAEARQGRGDILMTALRDRISRWVWGTLPGREGAFAAAIMTGDRSDMDRATLDALRGSNLAHLLAISGLHMGLLTGFVFAAVRWGLALVPAIALRLNTKKIGAVAALCAGAFYLGLSGGTVATERAFIMVSVMLVAVLFDRRALSLRAVALAAIIVLVLRPEALIGPGFQMSFAATAALVAVFGWLREREMSRMPGWVTPIAALLISSSVAGIATAPIGAAHFNQLSHYGLIANTVSVPLMGAVIIPAAVLAGLLAPLGLGWLGLYLMQPAIAWILGVADWITGLDGANSHVLSPPAPVLPILALGGLFLIIWHGRARRFGVLPIAVALAIWAVAERPPLLVSSTGGLVGVMGENGRALNKPRGESFAADSWLENDGDSADQAEAATRPGFDGPKGDAAVRLEGLSVVHLTGRGVSDRVSNACDRADLVVASAEVEAPAGCLVLDRKALEASGGAAIWPGSEGPRIIDAGGTARRLWTGAEPVPSILRQRLGHVSRAILPARTVAMGPADRTGDQ